MLWFSDSVSMLSSLRARLYIYVITDCSKVVVLLWLSDSVSMLSSLRARGCTSM